MLNAKSPFLNKPYPIKTAASKENQVSDRIDTGVSNFNKATNKEYNEDDYGVEEEDPEWVDIDVEDIQKNKIDFQPVPQNNKMNRIMEETNKNEDLDKSDDNNSKDDDDALNRLGKINYNNKIHTEIIPRGIQNNVVREENTNISALNILADKKIFDANDLFEIGNLSRKNQEIEKINTNEDNLDEEKVPNINSTEIQSSLARMNFFGIFMNETNSNIEGKSLQGLDEALIKNLFVSQSNLNSEMLNTNSQTDLIENSPDKQNILLKTLNFTSELQKNIFLGRKESGDNETENQGFTYNDEQSLNPNDKSLNNNQKDGTSNSQNNNPEINKDLVQRFNEELKNRGINPQNFNFNMANANFNNMIFNSHNNLMNKNTTNNINTSDNKNLINNNLINNRLNIPPSAIPGMIQAPNMIPYPLINREMMINNMIQQGLIKPNLNMNTQRQNLTPHQLRYLESLKNAPERAKNQNVNVTSNSEFKDKSQMHQNFLENPVTVIEKNLVKKGWAIMDDKNKPIKFLNSIELQTYLDAEKKKNNIGKMNFICDYESDMYFKPADLLEELQEETPKLIENLSAKTQQQKMQTPTQGINDLRMMGFPIINPVAMQNLDKDYSPFKIPGMPLNINPLMIDQRIVNMNMIPPFPHIANVRGNAMNNINNNLNGQAVNMNINLQFVNNDIKLNNITVDNSSIRNSNNTEESNDNTNDNKNNNTSNNQQNKRDSGSYNNSYNVNMIPPGFNKNILHNFQKGQNIPNGFPINPNFNMSAVNNMYYSALSQMMQNNNPNNKGSQNLNNINNTAGQIKNKNIDNHDSFSNMQNENMTKSDLNSFFGNNVFYEQAKNNNRANEQIKMEKNLKANLINTSKGNKTNENNKPSNLSQIVNFKGNTTNSKYQNYKK